MYNMHLALLYTVLLSVGTVLMYNMIYSSTSIREAVRRVAMLQTPGQHVFQARVRSISTTMERSSHLGTIDHSPTEYNGLRNQLQTVGLGPGPVCTG